MSGYEFWAWHGPDGEVRECRRLRVLLLSRYLPTPYAWWLNHISDPVAGLGYRLGEARRAFKDAGE